MSDTVFNTSFWFENDTYQEYEEYVYNSRKKQDRDDFSTFLIANLKELEFKKMKKKRKGNVCYEFTFESDKKQKIRAIEEKDGVHVIALYNNKENGDIDEEIVDRDKGQLFNIMMDRIMDALEVIECAMFDLETKTKTNLARTQNQIERGKEIYEIKKNKKDKDDESDYEEEEEEEEEDSEAESELEEEEEDDESESSFDESNKRRSARLSSKKNKKRKRKRKRKQIESENDELSDGSVDKPKRKRRKINKSEFRKMKRVFVKNWKNKEYIEAIHYAEDEYNMEAKEINDLIEDIYDDV